MTFSEKFLDGADRVPIDLTRGSGVLQSAILAAGPQIMAALLLALLGPSPLVRVHKAACIVAGLIKLQGSNPQAVCQWLEVALTHCEWLVISKSQSMPAAQDFKALRQR